MLTEKHVHHSRILAETTRIKYLQKISKIHLPVLQKGEKYRSDATTTSDVEAFSKTARQPRNPEQPSKDETNLYEQLNMTDVRCTVLTVVEKYAEKCIPESSVANLHHTLNTLFKYEHMSP